MDTFKALQASATQCNSPGTLLALNASHLIFPKADLPPLAQSGLRHIAGNVLTPAGVVGEAALSW